MENILYLYIERLGGSDDLAFESMFTLANQVIETSKKLTEISIYRLTFTESQIESIWDKIYDYQLEKIKDLYYMSRNAMNLQSVSKSADVLAQAPNLTI